MFDDTLKVFVKEIKTWEGFEEYVPKFEELIENNLVRLQKIYAPNEEYNVLNHGDHHTKNLLFKKIDGQINEVAFVSSKKYYSILIFTNYLKYSRLIFNSVSLQHPQSI